MAPVRGSTMTGAGAAVAPLANQASVTQTTNRSSLTFQTRRNPDKRIIGAARSLMTTARIGPCAAGLRVACAPYPSRFSLTIAPSLVWWAHQENHDQHRQQHGHDSEPPADPPPDHQQVVFRVPHALPDRG